MIAYHLTTLENYQSIIENGLTPQIGPRSESLGELHPRIYLFPDKLTCIDAISNWLGEEFDEEEDLIILQLDITGYSFDSEVGYEITVNEPIPKNRIIKTYSELEFSESIINETKSTKKNRLKI